MKKHMKTPILYPLLTIFLLSLLPDMAAAQIWKDFGKKVEKKIEDQASRRLERKVDKTIDKGMDKVEQAADDAVKGDGKTPAAKEPAKGQTTGSVAKGNSKTTDAATPAEKQTIPDLQAAAANVSISESYDFPLGISYDMQTDAKNSRQSTTMWFGKEDYIGMSVSAQKDMFMVMQNSNMVTFMLKQKKYMALGSGMMKGVLNTAAEEASKEDKVEDFSIKKIGTEKILNYNCDVYEVKSSEYTTKIWLTQDLGVEGTHFMSAFSMMAKSQRKFPDIRNQAGGLMLKMEGKSTKDKDTMLMEATQIHSEGFKFNTSGYSSLGF